MNNKIIEIKNLYVDYGKYNILKNMNLDITFGECVAIVGANGSGKSTLVKTIASLIKPSSGSLGINTKKISYMAQSIEREDNIFPISANEVINMALNKNDDNLVNNIAKDLGIQAILSKRMSDLSGGQKQKVFLARSLINNPDLLILDEPTSAFDLSSREQFYNLIKNISKDKKMTVFIVSHDVHDIWKYVDKILLIDREIKFFGTGEEYFDKYERNI